MEKERYEILFEEMSSKIQLVLEGHATLDRRIEHLQQNVNDVRKELGHVEEAVTETNQRLDMLMNRFDAHERIPAGKGPGDDNGRSCQNLL